MIVITGAAGFIGRHLLRYLLGRTTETILALDNLSRGTWNGFEADPSLMLVTGDIGDRSLLQDAFSGASLVFHLAAQSNVMGAMADVGGSFSSNVIGTFNVLQAAARAGVEHVVFTSSREVYGEPNRLPVAEEAPASPKNPYGASKVACEAYCRALSDSKTHISVLRLANVYGPGDRDRVIPSFIKQARQDQPLVIHGPGKLIDFVSVDLVVEALWRAANLGLDQPVNVGSGRGTTLPDLAWRIVHSMHSHSEIQERENRAGEVSRFVADVTRMQSRLNLSPPEDPLIDLDRMLPPVHSQLAGLSRRSMLTQ